MRGRGKHRLHRRVDNAGAVLAGLCAVHCLAVPLLFALLPSLTVALHSFRAPNRGLAMALLQVTRWEWLVVTVASLVALASTLAGVVRHRNWLPPACAAIGGLLLAGALLWPGAVASPAWHAGLAVTGGALLAAAHLLNRRAWRA